MYAFHQRTDMVDDSYRYPPARAKAAVLVWVTGYHYRWCVQGRNTWRLSAATYRRRNIFRFIVRWHVSACFRHRCQVILVGGRVRGAMLIGDTGLEETFENLILSGTNVSDVGADLLSLDVDVEDFFD